MKKAKDIKRKTYLLSQSLVKKAQSALHAKTETDTVIQALEYVTFEKEALSALSKTAGKGKGHFDQTLFNDWRRTLR